MKFIILPFILILSLFNPIDQDFLWDTPMEHNFGDIRQHTPVSYNFVLNNTSDEPFIIDNVRTVCGCTAPNWDYEPIDSGSYSTIRITFDAKKVGYFRKKIKVYLSCQRKAEILYIEGFVE